MTRGSAWQEVGLAVAVAAVAALLWSGAGDISLGSGYDRIGPRVFPYAVSAGLALLAGVLALAAWRGRSRVAPRNEGARLLDWRPLVPLGLALVLLVLLLERLGFVVAASLQFVAVTRSFRSRHLVRDAVAGVVLALVVYVAFSYGLGLSLPAGVLEGLL